MALAYPRALGPGVRRVIGDDELVEVGHDDGVTLLRPRRRGRALLVLHQRPPDTAAVLAEADRLAWLDARGGAPEVLASGRADEGDEALALRVASDALTAAAGYPLGPERLIDVLSAVLRELHDLDVSCCPFDASFDVLRREVEIRLERDQIVSATTGPYADRSPAALVDLLDSLFSSLDPSEAVMIHGGIRADRVWFDPAGGVSMTGWRRTGIGDRHVDLAAAAALVQDLYGPALVAPLLDGYGLDDVDLRRLDAHQLLAHLLR